MSHRHATDRKEATVLGGCPNDCQALEMDVEGREESVDNLVEQVKDAFETCPECGEPLGYVQQDEPTEVLE